MTFVENPLDFLDDFGVYVIYSPPEYIADHPSSKSSNVLGIFSTEWQELNGIEGLYPILSCFIQGEKGGRLTYTALDGTQTDYWVRSIQNDGTDYYKWILEEI